MVSPFQNVHEKDTIIDAVQNENHKADNDADENGIEVKEDIPNVSEMITQSNFTEGKAR